ncbi:MAG: hypothetical protein ABI678_04365 [Kofleriaceae bacterium]
MRPYLLLFLVACATTGDLDSETDADVTATDLSVRAGDTTITVNKAIARHGDTFTLHGKTSRNLTDGNGFVFDDPYGTFVQPSPRTFELTWQLSELQTLAASTDQFISLGFVHSASRPDRLTARAVVAPRLDHFTGSTKIYLTAALTPIVVAGVTVFRISGHSTDANTEVLASVGTVTRVDGKAFTIDLTADQVFALTAGGDVVVTTMLATGGVQKHATLGLELAKLGATAGDAYEQWPHPTCTTKLKTCLTALADGATDTASCGDAFHVMTCQGTIGVVVDDVAFQAALHATDTVLATAASRADAVALAGADQADAFLEGAKSTVESRFEKQFGRWYLSATARGNALDADRIAGIDAAYAHPLDLILAHPVHVGDAAAMRQVAADAVLAELARMDFLHGELARSLDQLVHEARAQHVADIGAFRTTIDAEPYPGQPTWDVYVGSWLGLHTEVAIIRATGAIQYTLVEID